MKSVIPMLLHVAVLIMDATMIETDQYARMNEYKNGKWFKSYHRSQPRWMLSLSTETGLYAQLVWKIDDCTIFFLYTCRRPVSFRAQTIGHCSLWHSFDALVVSTWIIFKMTLVMQNATNPLK